MRRAITATTLQLLAAAAVIISFQPCLALLIGGDAEGGPQGYYERTHFDYLIIRSLLIALAGLSTGVVLFWITDKIKAKAAPGPQGTSMLAFAGRRIGIASALVVGAIITFHLRPDLSDVFRLRAVDKQVPVESSSGMVFMVMSNQLGGPRIEFSAPDDRTNLWLNTNVSIAVPKSN